MFPYKLVRIMKFADILCVCVVIGSILFGHLVGQMASRLLAVSVLLAMHNIKPLICRAIFVCPHCRGKGFLRGGKWWPRSWPNKDDVVFCPYCGKAVIFVDL